MQRGVVLTTVILLLVNMTNITASGSYIPSETTSPDCSLIEEKSCSVLTCAIGGDVLFGNNQDGLRGTPYIAFGNTVDWNIGGLWVFDQPICYSGYMTSEGKPTSTEASMNQDGLCVAVNGLPPIPMYIDPAKENYTVGSGAGGPIHECGSVDDVIAFYGQYNYIPDGNNPVWGVQLQYADASGDAVVVGGNENGNVTFTHKNESAFIVSTNHNLVVPDNYYPGHYLESHERFDTATQMLEDVVTHGNLTVEAIRDILDAIHSQDPLDSLKETSHSFIFNPKTLDIYVYYRHDFTRVFTFNLLDEISTLEVDETRVYNLTELYENWEAETPDFLERQKYNKIMNCHFRNGLEPKGLEAMKSYGIKKGIFHSYSGPPEMIDEITENGFYISYGSPSFGSLSVELREYFEARIPKVHEDFLIVEIDVLARGKDFRPPSEIFPSIVETIARMRKTTPEEIVALNHRNVIRLIGDDPKLKPMVDLLKQEM